MDFIRFMFCLGVGLIGLCMVLVTVLETLFSDWDVAAEMRVVMRRRNHFLRRLLERDSDDHRHGGHGGRINAYGRPARPEPRIEYAAKALPAPVEREAEAEPEREPVAVG